jgi:hypothetical protein
VELSSLTQVPGTELTQAKVSAFGFGAFEIPDVPGVHGVNFTELETNLGVDLDGMVGSRLLAAFRLTLTDQGRGLWVEDAPMSFPTAPRPEPAQPQPPAASDAPVAPPAAPGAAKAAPTSPASPKAAPDPKAK